MNRNLLLGRSRFLLPVPSLIWQWQIRRNASHIPANLNFMSKEHHLIRNFVVREIARLGQPLSPDFIAESLALPVTQVIPILEELEKHMTFLFRNPQGEVVWAYPVTAEKTPHHMTLSTGEQVYAA